MDPPTNALRLGLMVRWSYGYRYLLAAEDDYKSDEESGTDSSDTPPRFHRRLTMDADENTPLIYHTDPDTAPHHTHPRSNGHHRPEIPTHHIASHSRATSHSDLPSDYEYSTAGTSPIPTSTRFEEGDSDEETEDIISFPPPHPHRPRPLLKRIRRFCLIAWREFLEFMNMPLWAMLVAVAVALFPQLQRYLFFRKDGFVHGSVIYAIKTLGDVSIPLILVILGANIANEDPPVVQDAPSSPIVERKWSLTQRQRALILGVASRMIVVPV
jgi:auxin efflux carrier family protein